MFEELKQKVEKQVVDELIIFTIAGYQRFKGQSIPEHLIISQCTQTGTISKERIDQGLKRLEDNNTILHNTDGWKINTMTKQVKKVFKEVEKVYVNKTSERSTK